MTLPENHDVFAESPLENNDFINQIDNVLASLTEKDLAQALNTWGGLEPLYQLVEKGELNDTQLANYLENIGVVQISFAALVQKMLKNIPFPLDKKQQQHQQSAAMPNIAQMLSHISQIEEQAVVDKNGDMVMGSLKKRLTIISILLIIGSMTQNINRTDVNSWGNLITYKGQESLSNLQEVSNMLFDNSYQSRINIPDHKFYGSINLTAEQKKSLENIMNQYPGLEIHDIFISNQVKYDSSLNVTKNNHLYFVIKINDIYIYIKTNNKNYADQKIKPKQFQKQFTQFITILNKNMALWNHVTTKHKQQPGQSKTAKYNLIALKTLIKKRSSNIADVTQIPHNATQYKLAQLYSKISNFSLGLW